MPMKIRATVICEENRHILLVRKPNSRWALPGGTIERGESHADAALRELAEETGLGAENLLYLMRISDGDTLHHVFEASVSDIGAARPQNEISDCLWYPLDTIAQLQMKKGMREILEAFRRRL
jgi:8-oxo-dGTP diphosphatase